MGEAPAQPPKVSATATVISGIFEFLWYLSGMADTDRSARLRDAVMTSYQASVPAQTIESDLAILAALAPRRAQKRTLFVVGGLASLVVLPFIGCSQSNTSVGGGIPLIVCTFLGIVICVAAFALRGKPIVVRNEKIEMLRALVRRIDFAAGQPVNVRANVTPTPRLVSQDYHAAGARAASYVKVFEDAWLVMDGRLSNGVAAQLSHSTLFGREETAHSRIDTAVTVTETVTLMYPVELNAALAGYGPGIAQHLQLAAGTKLEGVTNQPGSLSVRISFESPIGNRPEPLAALLAQALALIDRSRAYVQVDRDAWPATTPTAAEISSVRI